MLVAAAFLTLLERRELHGGSVLYVNQPVVEAALHGRLLVIEGLEKAERNLLPRAVQSPVLVRAR